MVVIELQGYGDFDDTRSFQAAQQALRDAGFVKVKTKSVCVGNNL